MKRKYKLRSWVKYTLAILAIIVSMIIVVSICKTRFMQLDNLAKDCDNKMGYTCTYYEIKNYSLRG